MAHEPVQDSDPTIGRLVSDASRDISSLISNEIGGLGVALFAAAGFFAVMALIMLSVAIAYFINWNGHGLSLHWAFLIVFGFYLLVAALLGLIGVRKVKQVKAPEKAIEQAQGAKQILKRG